MLTLKRLTFAICLLPFAMLLAKPAHAANNAWTDRMAGTNVPGGAASIVSSLGFETPIPACSPSVNGGSGWSRGVQGYAFCHQAGTPSTDCAVAADGNCSLKFTNQAGYVVGDAGWYDYNFCSPVGTCEFGNGQEFYIQYKRKEDPSLLAAGATSNNGGGMKQHIITEGDTPTLSAGDCSNSPAEFVTVNDWDNGFPVAYSNCGYSTGSLNFMNTIYQGIDLGGIADTNYLDQPAAGCPHYRGRSTSSADPTCFNYVGGEWETFQMHIKVGTFNTASSVLEEWAAHPNSPAELIINAADAAIANDGSGGATGKYGKISLSTYDTGATFNVAGSVWFDDLIVSTRRIPDPDVATPNAPDSLSLSNILSNSITVNWRVNSHNGTAQDDTGFLVERCVGTPATCFPNPQSGFSQIGIAAAGASSFSDNTVTSGATYTYRVRARNASGNSGYAASICFNGGTTCGGTAVATGTGTPPPPPPPPAPSACDVNGDGQVNVADVQKEVNMDLQIIPCTNPSGTCNVSSVQKVVNAALGGTCVSP